ncbi:GIDE domain-containing protein [Geoalkalibacter sp.]|uniref:GIDE domain-containing protein n=1 Tax=Geoalkalibacter sp. TaxID=3041440 RepID=UPI00272E301D|nr:GIDE domain-containing protein [Geoalkalibacter sp.]
MSETHYLLISRAGSETQEMRALLPRLAEEFRLDAFTARQRLLGRGTALLAQGARPKLEKLAALLDEHGMAAQLVRPTPPRFAPIRMRRLRIQQDYLEFSTPGAPLRLERGERVLAILADLSGEAIGKNLRRLMVQNTYQGAAAVTPLSDEELRRAVLRAQPVLDLYLLDAEQGVRAAVRLVAGGFDPSGLEERATSSSVGNMEQLLDLVREYAGEFILRCDFGLALLPGCQLRKAENGEDVREVNLAALTRFGWLMSDSVLQRAALEETRAPGLVIPPGLEELRREIAAQDAPATEPPASGGVLPPPPRARAPRGRWGWRRIFGTGAAAGTGLALLFGGEGRLVHLIVHEGMRTGLLPAAVSAGLFTAAFYCLRIKRLIENTPTSRIRSLAMGMVELNGHARRKYALVSPATQTACVWYRLRRYRRNEKSAWQLISESDSGAVPFLLDDGTGTITVDPQGARIKPTVQQEGFPGQEGLLVRSLGSDETHEKWVEELIHEGAFLYVLGSARPHRTPGPSLTERTREALRELKLDPKALEKYDRNGDGRIDAEEWDLARAAVEEQTLRDHLHQRENAAPGNTQAMIGRSCSHTRPFIIAQTESEAHLTRGYTWSMAALFAAALGAAVWALKQMLPLFGLN